MSGIDLVKLAVMSAYEKKGTRIVVQDLRGISDVCDYQFVCSGESDRQTKAIAQFIEERCLQSFGLKPIAIEGKQSGHWILLDYGSVLAHIFYSPLRDFYAVEHLWTQAKFLDIKTPQT